MRSFYFAVELRGAGFDINMPNTLVFDMPVEQGLVFMSSIGSYLLNAERELVGNMIDKMNGILLSMSWVNIQCSNTRGIIDCSVLVTFELSAVFPLNIRYLISI